MQPAARRPLAAMALSLVIAASAVAALPILRGIASGGGVQVASGQVEVSVDRQQLVRLPIRASHVALRWTGASDVVMSIAVGRTRDRLSEEIPIGSDADARPTEGLNYSDVIWADGARFARITTDRPIEHLTVVAMDTDESRGVDESGVVSAAVNAPAVITRAGWGADESYSENAGGYIRFAPNFTPVQKLIVHHTAGRNNDPNPAATIRAIFYDHAVLRGYGDIDYNYLIDAQGRVYEGRRAWVHTPLTNPTEEDLAGNVVRGAHARHFNDATVGIVLLGNFTNVMPTTAARTSLVNLLAWKAERHGIDPKGASTYVNPVDGTTKFLNNISGHRNVSVTACPGEKFYKTFAALRQDVADKIASTTGPGVDHTAPSVISLAAMTPDPTGARTIPFGLIFKEPVTGLGVGDFTVDGTSGGWTVESVTGKASTYTVTVVADEGGGGPGDGTVILKLAAAGVTDKAGHNGPAGEKSAQVDYAAETEPPTATLYAAATRGEPAGTSYGISVEFDEPVVGFGPEDVQIGGTSNAAAPWVLERILGQDANYNFTVHRDSPATGTLTVQVEAGGVHDLAGNSGDGSNVIAKVVDHAAPTTTTPTANLRSDTNLNAGTLRVDVTWSGTDVGPAGISSYDIARSWDGHAFETVGTSLANPSLLWSLNPVHTYRFRVRARDTVGNLGSWKEGPTIDPALTEQWYSTVHYTGSTTTTSYANYSGGSQRYLGAAGASASYTTTARSLSFVTTQGPTRGSAEIWIDGALATTIDMNDPTTRYQRVAFSKTWSSVGTHTIKVVSLGTFDRVDVDAFGVIR